MTGGERYTIISADCHGGGDLRDYRDYLPSRPSIPSSTNGPGSTGCPSTTSWARTPAGTGTTIAG